MAVEVTEVKVYPIKNPKEGSTLRAFAKVILNEDFAVTSLRVVDGQKGMFVGFPQQKDKSDEYHDIAFPITKECRSRIADAILEKYAESAGTEYEASADSAPPQNTDSDW